MNKNFNLIDLLNLKFLNSNELLFNNIKILKFNQSFFFNNLINDTFYIHYSNNKINFYYNLFYLCNNNITDINNKKINNFINLLILNISNNKQFFKNLKKGCKKNVLINFIENKEENEYILQYISDFFNINIIVLDCEINKIHCYYNNNEFDKYKNIFIFTKLNNKHYLLFKKNKYIFEIKDIPWFSKNMDLCQRCNLNCKIDNFITNF